MTEGDEDKLTQQLGETSLNENSSKEEKKTSSLMAKWNLSAPSFVPNPNAAAFVPSFAMGGSGAAGNPFAMVGESQAPAAAPVKEKPAKSNAAPAQTKASAPKKQPTPAKAETQEEPAELTAEEKKATQEFYAEEEEDDIPEDPNQKEHMNIVFIGHVDAGKSTMGGHLLYLTGMVDKRTLDKYEREAREQNRESWYLSWALDTNDDERAKGKTVEVGRAHFETDTKKYTILDAPGHKSYVPHMISGANQADVAVLVISARKGEFETGFEKGGQTREHVELVKTFGVQRLIVVINKMDDSTVGWSKERYDEIVGKLTPFVRSRGFKIGSDTVFMPVSGFTGANLKDKMTSDMCPWYDGPSLLQYLDNISGIDRQVKAPFLMPILDHFKDAGVIVTGKIEAGRIAKGKHLVMMPTKKSCEVLMIEGDAEEELATAQCGDNVKLKLKGIEDEEISRGFVLCAVNAPVPVVTQFEAQLMIMETKNIISAGYGCVMHVHTLSEEVEIGALLHLLKGKKRSKNPPAFVKAGQACLVRIETKGDGTCLDTYKNNKHMGRFTLRDEGKTIAIGKITKLLQ